MTLIYCNITTIIQIYYHILNATIICITPVSYTHLDVYKRQRVHKVQNGVEYKTLRDAGGDSRTGPVDVHLEGTVAKIRPEERYYGRRNRRMG